MINNESKYEYEKFFENVGDRVGAGNKIENEGQLKLAEGLQKIDHKDRRIDAEMAQKDAKIEELKTDRKLKKIIAFAVFGLLFLETILLFIILFFQGFSLKNFDIDDTTLNIFAPATILQISSMAIIITRYLFSSKK